MKKYLNLLFCASLIFVLPVITSGQIITTIAGNGMYGYSGDGGPATTAQVEYVWFVALDSTGNVYITDNFNQRVRKVNTADTISTFAGHGSAGFSGDSGLAVAAQFVGAAGIAVDRRGNVYFSDINNRRIRKVNSAGIITTVAGTGVAGFSGDGGPATAAVLNAPYGVAVDKSGNVYFSDELNNRVRKIDVATGIITTIAGNGTGGYYGEGIPATNAELTPEGIAVDGAGNVYFASNSRVRKVDTAGIITTVAGTGVAGFSGDGFAATTAKLNQPVGVASDWLGNLFISDQYNYRIRKVSTTGIISTIAGTGTPGSTGDGGAATIAEVRQPLGICTDPYDNVYFCDWGNYKVREIISGNHKPTFTNWPADSFTVCENSAGDSFGTLLAITDADTGQTETWTISSPARHGAATMAWAAIADGDTLIPSGAAYTPLAGYAGNDTFQVRVDDGESIDTITVYVRVKPLPDTGIITGNTNICMGTPDTLADTATGGIWSVTNPNASVSTAGVVSGLIRGTDTVLLSFTLEGCTSGTSYVVTLFPVADSITGATAVCTGESISLTGIPAGGVWNTTNAFAAVAGGTVYGDSAGVDTIIYTIANVCGVFSTIQPVVVIGFTIPGVIISSSPVSILSGEPDTLVVHLTHTGGISYSYQWQLDSMTIPGATDSVYISSTFLDADSVTCIITNGPCYFSTFSWIYITYYNDGVQGIAAAPALALYPNPNNGTLTLTGPISPENKDVAIDITDVTGREVYKAIAPVDNGRLKNQITLKDNFTNGVYFLRVLTSGGPQVMQFVVNR